MSDLAIPYKENEDFIELDAKASQTAITRGQFVKWESGGTGDVVVATADESGRVIGIASKDEVDDVVQVYVGNKPLKVPQEASATIDPGDALYVASATELAADADVGASATAVGVAIREDSGANWVAFWPLWDRNRAQADSVS